MEAFKEVYQKNREERKLNYKKMENSQELDKIAKLFKNVPFSFDWVEYKGQAFFAGLNIERSIESKKPMIDLFYCATKALNDIVLKTVQYDKNKFKYPSSKFN